MTEFLVVGLNPTLQNTFVMGSLRVGEVNRVEHHRIDVAGKGGNTARVLTQLGERAVHLTYCGGRNAELYRTISAREGVHVSAVESRCGVRFCHTVVEPSGQATEIVEPGGPADAELEAALLDAYRIQLDSAHTVIISGSKAAGFSPDIYPAMVRLASEAGIRTILDIRGEDLLHCLDHRPTLLKINVAEFVQTFLREAIVHEHMDPADLPDELPTEMKRIHTMYGMEIVLTHGRHPVLFLSGNQVLRANPERIVPVNPIGSGDAFTAGLATGLLHGRLEDGVVLGLECAQKNALLEQPGSIV